MPNIIILYTTGYAIHFCVAITLLPSIYVQILTTFARSRLQPLKTIYIKDYGLLNNVCSLHYIFFTLTSCCVIDVDWKYSAIPEIRQLKFGNTLYFIYLTSSLFAVFVTKTFIFTAKKNMANITLSTGCNTIQDSSHRVLIAAKFSKFSPQNNKITGL